MPTVQLVQQTVVEEVKELELSPEEQAQFDKLESTEDRAAFLEAMLDDPEASVNIKESKVAGAVTHIYDTVTQTMKAVARSSYLDYLTELREAATPVQDFVVRFARIDLDNDGERVADSRHFEATSYQDAVEQLLKDTVANGEVIDWIYNQGDEELPALIQLDDRVFDLTACGDRPVTLVSGMLESHIQRTEESYSQTVRHAISGEELDVITITDEDYRQGAMMGTGPAPG
jgi:hypothetical protein